jgi:type VI secretion system secreted protein Hcp
MLNVLMGLFGLQAGAAVAQDVTLCLAEIKGDSRVEGRQDCIDILAWSWGVGRGVSNGGGGGGRETSAPSFSEMTVTKDIDIASPELFAGAYGKAFPKVELFIDRRCQDTCGVSNALTITMENVLISSLSEAGSDGGGLGSENISLNYTKIVYCYTGADKNGNATEAKCKGFDIEKGTGIVFP